MEVVIKLFIGFAVFFTGVIFNVHVMRRTEGGKGGMMPMLSFVVICAGLIILVLFANSISVQG